MKKYSFLIALLWVTIPSFGQAKVTPEMESLLFDMFPDKTPEYIFDTANFEKVTFSKKDRKKYRRKKFSAISVDGYHAQGFLPEIGEEVWKFRGIIFYMPGYRDDGALLVEGEVMMIDPSQEYAEQQPGPDPRQQQARRRVSDPPRALGQRNW